MFSTASQYTMLDGTCMQHGVRGSALERKQAGTQQPDAGKACQRIVLHKQG